MDAHIKQLPYGVDFRSNSFGLQVAGIAYLQGYLMFYKITAQFRVLYGADAMSDSLCAEPEGIPDTFRPVSLPCVDGKGKAQFSGLVK